MYAANPGPVSPVPRASASWNVNVGAVMLDGSHVVVAMLKPPYVGRLIEFPPAFAKVEVASGPPNALKGGPVAGLVGDGVLGVGDEEPPPPPEHPAVAKAHAAANEAMR